MPDKDDLLQRTFEGLETDQKVYNSLLAPDNPSPIEERIAKTIGLLINALEEKGVFTEDEIEKLLFHTLN